MEDNCTFCDIANGTRPASIVYEDELTMAFIDIRQFHSGHTLVIPRRHVCDIRHLDETTGPRSWRPSYVLPAPLMPLFPTTG